MILTKVAATAKAPLGSFVGLSEGIDMHPAMAE